MKVDADGTAKVDFEMPDFNGTVRVMAVAWSADKLGHAVKDVIVRDAVALTASGPRFLTLGDEARLDIAVHNVEGPAASYKLAVDAGANERAHERSLDLKAGERRAAQVSIKPEPRSARSPTPCTSPGRTASRSSARSDVRREAARRRHQAHHGHVAQGRRQPHAVLRPRCRHDRRTHHASTSASARWRRMDVPGLLTALDRYPYGCAEQTVSRALPLVYANAVAAGLGMAPDKELKDRVQKAVDRVFEMQDGSGAFGVWGPIDGDLWLTGYVTDFLTRAKEQGFNVNPRGLHGRRSTGCRTSSPTRRTSRRAARTAPTRSTCSPATAARRSASCATTPTRGSSASRRRWPRPSSAPRWR